MGVTPGPMSIHIQRLGDKGYAPCGGGRTLEVDPTEAGSRLGHHATATTYLEDLGAHFGQEITVEVVQ